jgi:glycosyltransferase involved in cell wall biosynthesis
MKVLFVVVEDKAFLIQRLNTAMGVKADGHEVYVASRKSELSQKIVDLGFHYIDTGTERKSRNPLREFKAILRLAEIYRNLKPDLVHHVSIKPVLYGSLAAKIARVPRVVNLINGLGFVFVEAKTFKRQMFKRFIRLFYKIALWGKHVKVIFQNPDDKRYFIRKKIVKEYQTEVILGSGVDTERFKPSESPELPVRILFCSRMLWDKGISYLIEAIKKLKSENLDFRVSFVGEPDPQNPNSVSMDEIKAWEQEGLIEYLGFQSDIPKLLGEHHIVTLPTFYREGVPLSLIEAASAGKPIVTTDMPGCREIVVDGFNGHIVKPRCSEELYLALKNLIIDADSRKKYGANSRYRVMEKFSKEVVNKQTLAVYDSFFLNEIGLIKSNDQSLPKLNISTAQNEH